MDPTTNNVNTGDNYSWIDITDEFKNSVKQLNLGELLKTEHFTLLEAMSAIELMDPKMDCGMILKKSNRKILTLEQSIRVGAVKTNHLKLNELIGIIDDTFACLVTWLEGHYSLAQTLMTNLYLHEPERIEDRCLRVFSQSILKIVGSLDSLVHMVHCIEEEDFQLNVGKFKINSHQINDQKVLNSLEDLWQHYEKLLVDKQTTGPAQTNSHQNINSNSNNNNNDSNSNNNIEQQQSTNSSDAECNQFDKKELAALANRLRFTSNFFASILNISRRLKVSDMDLVSYTDAQLMKATKLVHNSALTSNQHLEKCLKYLKNWEDSINLGIKPEPSSIEDRSLNEGDYPTIMGFEPLINIKLLPPAYPRCPSIRTRPATIDYLRDLILKLQHCISISNSFSQKSFNKSSESIEEFSKYFRPSSCVISRTILQALYLPIKSDKLMRDELLQSMSDYCDPLVQLAKKDETKLAALNRFLIESSGPFSQVINLYGHNTARQHEKFPDLIQCFKNLQYSAFMMTNGVFNNNIIYSWTTFHLARLCTKYIQSGLELELFSPHEYPYVFWYLHDILYRNEREQLELAKQFIYDSQFFTDKAAQKKNKGKTKQRKRNQYNTSFHDKSLICNDAFRFLSGGTFLLTYGLRLQGKIKSPAMDFTSEEICFDHRFGTLTGTTVYQSYKHTLSRLEKLEHIYREALDCFSEAKELFQTIGQHDNCLKVCKTNMVVARILSSNLNSIQDRGVEFCFDTHPSFPTIKV